MKMTNEEQYAITHDQLAREAYKHLHELGLNDNSDIRKKLEDLSRFMGEFGFSRLTNEQIGSINMWLKDLVSLNYQFINGLLQIK